MEVLACGVMVRFPLSVSFWESEVLPHADKQTPKMLEYILSMVPYIHKNNYHIRLTSKYSSLIPCGTEIILSFP